MAISRPKNFLDREKEKLLEDFIDGAPDAKLANEEQVKDKVGVLEVKPVNAIYKRAKRKKHPQKRRISLDIREDLLEHVDDLALANDISRVHFITLAIRKYISEFDDL